VLLELGALGPMSPGQQVRGVRAAAVLDVSFATRQEVIKAYSQDIGVGGIAIKADRTVPIGSTVELRIKLPDSDKLMNVEGTVAWNKGDSMGVSFDKLPKEDEQRLKDLLVNDASVLKRISSVLATDVRELAAKGKTVLTTDVRDLRKPAPPTPVAAASVDTRPLVSVSLEDSHLSQVTVELFAQRQVRSEPYAEGQRPSIVVVDTGTALAAANLGAMMVLVNVSGPDALVGKLVHQSFAAYVKRPATAATIFEAVAQLLGIPRTAEE
jgi:uncharacterized protein (TIGR02266 family)